MGNLIILIASFVCIFYGIKMVLTNKGVVADKVREGLTKQQIEKRKKIERTFGPILIFLGLLVSIIAIIAITKLGL